MSIVSAILNDQTIVELVVEPGQDSTRLCIYCEGTWHLEDQIDVGGLPAVPYSPRNNLIRHGVIVFPSQPLEYSAEPELVSDVQCFLHRYVDVSPLFEQIAAHYVLLSWIYDAFNDLPYLRVRGDFGTGKTRFLLTVGSICYKPMFASGASTVSPLFRMIDAFQGTLVLDESDFRFSDEKADIIKILNNGNARGFPVLRSEGNSKGEYDPRAYTVYGPKIIATRGPFEDRALESRCITEDLGLRPLRSDVPISLPDRFDTEAAQLRNKLLMFRFRNRHSVRVRTYEPTSGIEPRLLQVFAALSSVVESEQLLGDLQGLLQATSLQLAADRGMAPEGQLLEVLHQLLTSTDNSPLYLRNIREAFIKRFGSEYEWRLSSRWIGGLLRNRLHLRTQKSHGNYLLPVTEYPKLKRQFERYGIGPEIARAA